MQMGTVNLNDRLHLLTAPADEAEQKKRSTQAFKQIAENHGKWTRKDCPVCGKSGCSVKVGFKSHCTRNKKASKGDRTAGRDGKEYVFRGLDTHGLAMWFIATTPSKGHVTQYVAPSRNYTPAPAVNVNLLRRNNQFRAWAAANGLSPEHREDLRARGLNDAQIKWMVSEGLVWTIDFGDNPRHSDLPGKWDKRNRTGYSGAKGMAIACSQPSASGESQLVLGAQIGIDKNYRARKAAAGDKIGKYLWMSDEESRPAHIGNKGFGGQNPISCFLTPDTEANHITVSEGLLKPLIAFLRGQVTHGIDLGRGIIGVAGSSWTTYEVQIFTQAKRLGVKEIRLAVDAGTPRNLSVMRGIALFAETARQKGYEFKIIWYGQKDKPEDKQAAGLCGDIDDLNWPVKYELITIDQLISVCDSPKVRKAALEAMSEIRQEEDNFKHSDRTVGIDLTTLLRDYISCSSTCDGIAVEPWIENGYHSEESRISYGWRVIGDVVEFKRDLHKRRLRHEPECPYTMTLGVRVPYMSKPIVKLLKALNAQVEFGIDASDHAIKVAKVWRSQGVRTTRDGYGVNYWESIQGLAFKQIDERLNSRYLAGALTLKRRKLTAIKSAMGTGKTYLIRQMIDAGKLGRTLFVVNSRSLATAASEDLGAMRHDQINWSEIDNYNSVTICYDSLKDGGYVESWSEFARHFETVVFDEAEAGLAHITTSATLNSSRAEVQANWAGLVATKEVVIMDANLTGKTVTAYEDTANTVAHVVVNDYSTGAGRKAYIYDQKAALISNFYGHLLPALDEGNRLYYCSDSRRPRSSRGIQATTTVAELCELANAPYHLINQDTQSWTDHPDYGSMERLKGLSNTIVASPTISSGVSFDKGSRFDAVYAVFSGVISIENIHQMLGRVRDDVERHIFLNSFGFAGMSSPSLDDEQRREEMMIQGISEAAELNGVEGQAIKRMIKDEPKQLREWRLDYTTRQSYGAMDLRLNVARGLEDKGYKVIFLREKDRASDAFKQLVGNLAHNLYARWKDDVVAAPLTTVSASAKLIQKTREQSLSETRAIVFDWAVLEECPNLLDAEIVEMWDKHRRAIDRGGDLYMISMLEDFSTLQMSARDMKQFLRRRSVSVRDINSMITLKKVVEKTRLMEKLSELEGRHCNSDEQVKEVYDVLLAHADLIRQATGIKISQTVQGKYCQQVAKLARAFGYKANREGQARDEGGNKQNYWIFEVDEKVKGIWERRLARNINEYDKTKRELDTNLTYQLAS